GRGRPPPSRGGGGGGRRSNGRGGGGGASSDMGGGGGRSRPRRSQSSIRRHRASSAAFDMRRLMLAPRCRIHRMYFGQRRSVMALDRIDFEILSALQNDARLANKELAARIGMAPSSCLERVRTLTRAGVLRGSHADVDAAALGIGLEALVAIRLVKHSREAFRSLYATMLAMPEVLTV